MAEEIGNRVPRFALLLNTDDPITVTFTRQGGDYPPGAVLTLEVVDAANWPSVITGPTATVHATAAMVNAVAGATHWRARLTDNPAAEPSSVAKGPVIRDA